MGWGQIAPVAALIDKCKYLGCVLYPALRSAWLSRSASWRSPALRDETIPFNCATRVQHAGNKLVVVPKHTGKDAGVELGEVHMTNRAFVSRIANKFAAQRTSVRVLEISGAAMAVAVGLFGASLVASPAPTEAATAPIAQIDTQQITRDSTRALPSFDDTYQRHLGVLDTLRR
jgi:hypothetical protein